MITKEVAVRVTVNEDGQFVVALMATDGKTVVMAPVTLLRAESERHAREVLDRQGYEVVKKA